MSAAKTERLLNLFIMLLVQRHFVPLERIREIIYAGASGGAFERMFERDKEELRALGVPIETGPVDQYFDDDLGYRIRPESYALPDIDLAPDEASVVGLASRMWQHARFASTTSDALNKLTAAGVSVDTAALAHAVPATADDDPGFEALFAAVQDRQPVRFDYARGGQAEVATRHLQPWSMVRLRSRWYVLGHDTDRGEPRVFRLSRIRGPVHPDGEPESFTIPPGIDVAAQARALAPPSDPVEVEVLARAGRCAELRRSAEVIARQVPGPTPGGWDRLRVSAPSTDLLVGQLLSHGPDVYLPEAGPPREELVRRLSEVGTW